MDYKINYEELGKRKVRQFKQLDQRTLDTWTIWVVDGVLLLTVVLGYIMGRQ